MNLKCLLVIVVLFIIVYFICSKTYCINKNEKIMSKKSEDFSDLKNKDKIRIFDRRFNFEVSAEIISVTDCTLKLISYDNNKKVIMNYTIDDVNNGDIVIKYFSEF